MPPNLGVAQAWVVTRTDTAEIVARSPGVRPGVEDALLKLARDYGPRPPGAAPFPPAVFAHPLGRGQVAVAQVGDWPGPDSLGFRFLVWDRRTYSLLADPFALAERFPADWADAQKSSRLDDLSWPPEPLPPRTVAQLSALFQGGDPGHMPLLLGAAQSLVDGGRVHLAADQGEAVRAVWQLLPDRVRAELWPATFSPGSALRFDLWAGPDAATTPGVNTAAQIGDYPEGRYEYAVQHAVEHGEQRELDRLFARHSGRDVLRIAAGMVGLALVGAVVSKLL